MEKRDELRVHGVSGTPPRALLYWEPVSYLIPGEKRHPQARVWERNRDQEPGSPFRVKAFRWGNLTSGSKWSALWILLAPFAFSNVAGWMADGRRATQVFLRLSALGMTALFTAQLSVVGVDFVFQLVSAGVWPQWVARLAPLGLGLVLLLVLWRLSTRSQLSPFSLRDQVRLLFGVTRDSMLTGSDQQLDDPAPEAKLGDESMWRPQPVLHLLRRLHLAFALAVITLIVSWGTSATATGAALGVLVGVAVAVVSPGSRLAARIGQTWIWVAGAVLAWVSLGAQGTAGGSQTHQVVFLSVGLVLVAALGAVIAHRHPLRLDSWLPAGAVTVGSLLGGAFGVAVAVLAEYGIYRWSPRTPNDGAVTAFQIGERFRIADAQVMVNGGTWVVVAMMAFLLWLLLLGGVLAALSRGVEPARLPPRGEGRFLAMVRRVTLRARWLLGLTGAGGLAIAALGGWRACLGDGDRGCSPAALSVGSRELVWSGGPRFLDFDAPPLGLPPFDLRSLVDLAFVAVVGGIALFIVNSILRGWGDPQRRRKVGILWDVGSFWPRWFHPLAPPAYGPAAVEALRRRLQPEGAPVVTAHSQGSVIVAAALAKGAHLPEGLVTYGSPLGILYARVFPSAGVDGLCSKVSERMDGRWVNLWRDTDPLGGLAVPGVVNNRRVDTDTGHSRYELTIDFDQARRDVSS
ncbi:MAG: hypothetical protein ACE5F5_06390 [Acidimicrobiia bacterium]